MNFKEYLGNILQDQIITKWDSMYVPLPLTESGEEIPSLPLIREMVLGKPTQESPFKEEDFLFESTDLLNRLLRPEKSPLILVGDSGAGKTTTLRWIASNLAKIATKNLETTAEAQNIPVYLDLGTFHKDEFEDFFILCLEERKAQVNRDNLTSFLRAGKFVFLIDGLDILPPSNEFNPLASIQGFVSRYPKNNFLLTCRTGVCYLSFPDKYRIIKCLELNDEKIKTYLTSYIKDTQKKEQIWNQIMANPQLRETSRTPLVLILMTAAFLKYKEIPRIRAEIYSAYLDCIYTLFEKAGKFGQAERGLIQNILIELGFKMALENRSVLLVDDMAGIITSIMAKTNYKGLDKDEILMICRQLGFLKIEAGEVEFFYQTYKDYFAANRLKELFLESIDISGTYNHPKWEDTLVFLSGLLEPAQADKLIQAILKSPYEWQNPLFLAARCVAEGRVTDGCRQDVLSLLAPKLKDKFWFNQKEAIYGLTRLLGNMDIVPKESNLRRAYDQTLAGFSQRLKDKDWLYRERSARSLARMGERSVVMSLEKLLDAENPNVYNAAYEAIVEVERREKEAIKVSLPSLDEKPIPALQPFLKEEYLAQEKKEEFPGPIEAKKGKTALLTGLALSIIRSPELMQQLDETKTAIKTQLQENVFLPTIDMERGVVVKAIGSGIIATFENPKDAVYAAIKMQSGVDDYNLRQPSRKAYLRVGLHMEEISEEKKDSLRQLSKISIQIGKLARGGQILLSARTYKAIHGEDKTIKLRYLGSRRLREMDSEKIGIYELSWQDKGQDSMVKESIMAVEYLDIVSAFNTTKNKLIANQVRIARSFLKRLRNLMFTPRGQALLLEFPHLEGKRVTLNPLFVTSPVDILFLNAEFKVIELRGGVLPFNLFKRETWRNYSSKGPVKYVLELAAGTINATNTQLNDLVAFKERVM